MQKRTKEEFVEAARKVHGDKYDYSKVVYVNNTTPVIIICPIHGEFEQTPKNHLRYGCNKCGSQRSGLLNRNSIKQFIANSKQKFGDKYDYSKVDYKTYNDNVIIICPEHGEFEWTPTKHLTSKYGCPFCAEDNNKQNRRWSRDLFIQKSQELYGDKYDYSKVEYVNNRTPITIICPEHGEFTVTPLVHLHMNCGCKKCMQLKQAELHVQREIEKETERLQRKIEREKKQNTLITKYDFIKKAQKVHGNRYDYSKVEYVDKTTKVCIICPIHGEFWQVPINHINGSNCPKCNIENARQTLSFTTEEFIINAKKVHGDKYDYSKVEYVNSRTPVAIICPIHGEFWQVPTMHYNEGHGCPTCNISTSKGEREVLEYLTQGLGLTCETHCHDIIKRKEIDIFIPSHNIAIEYNGLRWHSDLFISDNNYHLNKTIECAKKGIQLIHIFEDEWLYRRDIVKSKLSHILKCESNKPRIDGRKCIVKHIEHKAASVFLEKNHIQGKSNATVYLGAFYNDELIGVMSFLKEDVKWTLNRFATHNGYVCRGIGGKLFKYFIKQYDPSYIKSFADKRWSSKKDNMYTKLGFVLTKELPPQYTYASSKEAMTKRYHKFNFRRNILHKKYKIPITTEREMTKQLGFHRVYDCGLLKYEWTKKNI